MVFKPCNMTLNAQSLKDEGTVLHDNVLEMLQLEQHDDDSAA